MNDHAGVAAQPRMKLPISDVDRVHPQSAALQQHVGEPSRRRSDVAADQAARIEAEVVEGMLQLEAAARNVAERLAALQMQLHRFLQQLPRLLDAVVARHHLAGEDERLRLAARLGQALELHEHVRAASRHHRSRGLPAVAGPMSAAIRASRRSMSIGFEK